MQLPSNTHPAAASPLPMRSREQLLEAIRTQFIGLDTCYPVVGGGIKRRIYLDSAASNLKLSVADDIERSANRHYANTHSTLHYSARIMTAEYHWAHEAVQRFVGASEEYCSIFCGNGVTGGLNRMARVLAAKRPERDTVITTIMEHHANDLPHRKHVGRVVHIPIEVDSDGKAGQVDLIALKQAVDENRDRLNYVAITMASNVTGLVNPVYEIAAMAHEADALIVVDAAQSAAHLPINVMGMEDNDYLDVVILSGHKIYSPGSPGVITARKELFAGLEPEEVGGGIVSRVETGRYDVIGTLPDREETGTPNIPGSLALGTTLHLLMQIGMDLVEEDERRLTQYALDKIAPIEGVQVYGSCRLEVAERIGVVTFNVDGLEHGLVTAALNDYFGIAVRNDCFCAQPFVRHLLTMEDSVQDSGQDACVSMNDPGSLPGMVRISLGVYNTEADIDAAAEALSDIASRVDYYNSQYVQDKVNPRDYRHKSHKFNTVDEFSLAAEVDKWIQKAL